jgi:hypothetical protein
MQTTASAVGAGTAAEGMATPGGVMGRQRELVLHVRESQPIRVWCAACSHS